MFKIMGTRPPNLPLKPPVKPKKLSEKQLFQAKNAKKK